jgi:hypothetical protein
MEKTTHKVYLAVWEIQDVQQVLSHRAAHVRATPQKRLNCYKACDWLNGLINGRRRIEEIEVLAESWALEGIAAACIEDGLVDVGTDILRQISEAE